MDLTSKQPIIKASKQSAKDTAKAINKSSQIAKETAKQSAKGGTGTPADRTWAW